MRPGFKNAVFLAAADSLTLPPPLPVEWVDSTVYSTNFANQAADEAIFDFANGTFTRGSDAGGTYITCALGVSPPRQIRTKTQMRDVRIKIAYRDDGGSERAPTPFARADTTTSLHGAAFSQNESYGNPAILDLGMQGNTNRTRSTTTFGNSSLTRYAVLECRGDLIMAKYWTAGEQEPATFSRGYWQIAQRYPDGASTFEGYAGVRFYAVNATYKLYELTVTKLLQDNGSNLLWNSDFALLAQAPNDITSTDVAAWWNGGTGTGAGTSHNLVTVAGPFGDNVTAVCLDYSISEAVLSQRQFQTGTLPFVDTTIAMYPSVTLPNSFEFSCWSKASGIAYPGGADTAGTTRCLWNFKPRDASANYVDFSGRFGVLGPSSTNGRGTWDWYPTIATVTIPEPQRTNICEWPLLLHAHPDGTNTQANAGQLWIYAPQVRPLS